MLPSGEIYPLDSVVQPWFEQLHPAGQLKLGIGSKTNDLVTCESSFLFIQGHPTRI